MYACHRKEKHGFMCLSVQSEGGGCELCFLSARQQKTTELIFFYLREEVQHGKQRPSYLVWLSWNGKKQGADLGGGRALRALSGWRLLLGASSRADGRLPQTAPVKGFFLLIKAFPPSAWRVLFKGRLRVSLYNTVRSWPFHAKCQRRPMLWL